MDDKKILKIVTLFFGLFFAGGFALGGIISYGSLINTGGQNSNNGQQGQPVTLPTENYRNGEYNLTMRERRGLAANNDIVFASLLYQTEQERSQMQQLRGVQNNFNGRMFLEVVNSSETTKFITMGNSTPRAVIISARRNAAVVPEPTENSVASAACNSLVRWGSTASYCTQYQ